MSELHPDPTAFEPMRWVNPDSADKSWIDSSCPFAGVARQLKKSGWHPGGIGAHGCPGLPLAELSGRIFLAQWVGEFKSWSLPEGGVDYELIPIKIPKDDFKLRVTPRRA
eukprot:gnl/TRDRNA2_/TRDRNA2_86299_c0_seq1.p1 gnl/TRDRNA2_/TRDRNA2_86299_c0~~gnl/TRDRNA2_/TRDRNA2_86299_c0_seq1.p1  ORF type:complete len:110 (+),score=16.80 gnl/TRDRNA2_/TRDRNA2_86299_c0_seq1:2-331(+)